jgi:hypothetical protein
MTMHNYPLSRKTKYKIFGYKKRGVLKEPHWITVDLATGSNLTPQKVGLDGFYSVEPLSQTGLISPKKEKDKDFSHIPDFTRDKNDTFIYSKNIISDRGYIEKNVLRK